jgi:endonuclease III
MSKRPFDIDRVMERIGEVVRPFPKAALFELVDEGFGSRLLVPFGKHVCTGVRPKCSTCPVLDMCRQVGVGEHR